MKDTDHTSLAEINKARNSNGIQGLGSIVGRNELSEIYMGNRIRLPISKNACETIYLRRLDLSVLAKATHIPVYFWWPSNSKNKFKVALNLTQVFVFELS